MHSERYKFIYFNAPKTASQSIRAALTELTDGEAVIPEGRHVPLKYYKTEGVLQAPLDEYFKFTFVRNPWARQVSNYHHQTWPKKEDWTFTEYCRYKTMAYQCDCVLNRYPLIGPPLPPTAPIQFDFVGRVENLQADFDALCDKLGLQRMTVPHIHTTEHGDYREYYDDETREIIAEKYARDIEIFGYTFDD